MPTQPNFTPAEDVLNASLPHRRNEAWKWTDVRAAVTPRAGGLTRAIAPQFDAPRALTISQGAGQVATQIMPKIASQFGGDVWTIDVPEGFNGAPLIIHNLTNGHGRIAITLGAGASLSLTEHHKGAAASFTNLDVAITLGKGASLTRTIIHDDPDDATRIVTANISMASDAKFEQFTLSFGSALTRLETRLSGEGADVNAIINGTYLLSGKRHCDMTSHIDLAQPNAHIRQAVKGVVTDSARGVFQGKFHVERAAQHTDAEMRHDALMLSDTSEIRSKPELEIYADDVACAHGNTIGQLDESALFYMRQRGISQAQARALLTQAFVNDVFDDLEDEALKESILGKIADWLGA